MFDAKIRPFIDPPLNNLAHKLLQTGLTGNHLTILGLGIGAIACVFVVMQAYFVAFLLLLFNRLIDGLDGPLARARGDHSDFGGYLDIICDFMIYAGFPLAIAIGLGTIEALYVVSFLLFAIVVCAVSFLAYALMAEKYGDQTEAQGKKSFFFSLGLLEGTETIIFLSLMCLWPQYFILLAIIFGLLCLVTAFLRTMMAYRNYNMKQN